MPTHSITPSVLAQLSAGEEVFTAVFERSANFRIELPFDAAFDFLRRIDAWNDFESAYVLDALESVDRIIPRNPRGDRSFAISVGREGSPVVYIDRHEFSWTTDPLSDATIQRIRETMELIGHADQSDCTVQKLFSDAGRLLQFRFWWD